MPFDLQPILKGALVELRPLRPDDYADLYAVASDPLICEQHPVKDRSEKSRFQRFFREALESGVALAVIDASTQRMIGSSRFHGYDEARSEGDLLSDVLASGAGPSTDRGLVALFAVGSFLCGACTIIAATISPGVFHSALWPIGMLVGSILGERRAWSSRHCTSFAMKTSAPSVASVWLRASRVR